MSVCAPRLRRDSPETLGPLKSSPGNHRRHPNRLLALATVIQRSRLEKADGNGTRTDQRLASAGTAARAVRGTAAPTCRPHQTWPPQFTQHPQFPPHRNTDTSQHRSFPAASFFDNRTSPLPLYLEIGRSHRIPALPANPPIPRFTTESSAAVDSPVSPEAPRSRLSSKGHEGGAPERLPAACEQGGQTCGPVCVL
jgi:hypothetical protein